VLLKVSCAIELPIMSHTVPSQACVLITKLMPELDSEQSPLTQAVIRQASDVKAVLDCVESIPDELIQLSPDEAALFRANVSALRSAWEDRSKPPHNNVFIKTLNKHDHTWPFEIKRLLAKCSDMAPFAATTGFEFIKDIDLRNVLRTDASSAFSDLLNHEYKSATVLAGSVVEAQLLWALEETDPTTLAATLTAKFPRQPKKALNEWMLGDMIEAAHVCGYITDDTKTQASLAQNFRNLIHPGRQARLKQECDVGTAYAALAAMERVAVDLKKKFP
jgi:hypothetical protein